MSLAIFDLDNTLIAGDSDHLWGEFLIEQGRVDAETYRRHNDEFYQQYKDGTLDIFEFLAFSLRPLSQHSLDELYQWRDAFIEKMIRPVLLPKAFELLERHRQQGDTLMIITATNDFVTRPIADLLGVDELIATRAELVAGAYTGKVAGTPCFQHGKVENLERWLAQNGATLEDSWFYSDSHNDIPLLEKVTHAFAVDADEALIAHASKRQWPVISLRET